MGIFEKFALKVIADNLVRIANSLEQQIVIKNNPKGFEGLLKDQEEYLVNVEKNFNKLLGE